jgi:hypothetical protein
LEAFYYCIVLLGGDANFMNKQAVGLSPPFHVRLQTPVEKAAVAARKVQRVVKKRLLMEAVAERKVQRVVTKTLKDMAAQLVEKAREVQSWSLYAQRAPTPAIAAQREATSVERKKRAKATVKERQLREAKKRAAAVYELEWEACWGGSTLSKRCKLPPAASSAAAPLCLR